MPAAPAIAAANTLPLFASSRAIDARLRSEFMGEDAVLALIGMSRATMWRWIKRGTFPRPIRWPGRRGVMWRRADVESFAAKLLDPEGTGYQGGSLPQRPDCRVDRSAKRGRKKRPAPVPAERVAKETLCLGILPEPQQNAQGGRLPESV